MNNEPSEPDEPDGTSQLREPSDAGEQPGDLVARALSAARASTRPWRRGDPDGRARTRRQNLAGRGSRERQGSQRGYSAAGPDDVRDPQRVGSLLSGWVDEQGWDRPLAEARVFADWAQLVGADVASHCSPQSLERGELRIAAASTAWATQLRLLGSTLLARLVAELGPDVVTTLAITGPVAPSWSHGNRSVRGARGPRDTYG